MSSTEISQIHQQIISDLKVISCLKPGKTLSTSTMTVIDHGSWATTFWRTYKGENKKETVNFIKNIFDNAVKTFQDNGSEDLLKQINDALEGFETLKETYKGYTTTIKDIDDIIVDVRERTKVPTLEECIKEVPILEEIIIGEINNLTEEQKISPDKNSKEGADKDSSNIKEMVETSIGESDKERVEDAINNDDTNDGAKDIDSMSTIDVISRIKIPAEASDKISDTQPIIKRDQSDSNIETDSDSPEESYQEYSVDENISDKESVSSSEQSLEESISRSQSENNLMDSEIIKKTREQFNTNENSDNIEISKSEIKQNDDEQSIDFSTWIHIQSSNRSKKEGNSSSPPIIRLARAFKQWLKTIKNNDNTLIV